MTPALRKYLDLEKLMLDAEAIDDAAADAVRDVMDAVWYRLTVDEHRVLDERDVEGPIRVLESVRLPASTTLWAKPMIASAKPYDGKPVPGWRRVA